MEDPKQGRAGPESEPGSAEEGAGAPAPGEAPGPSPRASERMADARWLAQVGRGPRPQGPDPPEAPARTPRPHLGTRVAVCDDGELDDVVALLRELDHAPLRLRPADLAWLEDWERPSQLLVTTVRIALAHEAPIPDAAAGGVAIAVAEGPAAAPCSAALRRGFGYVVRRPVHPAALRLLLSQVLWRGPESRGVARFPFGAEIRWRAGLRRGTGTMVEVSAHGCRLTVRERFSVGDRIHLRVPAALTGSRDLRLKGRILRRDRGNTGAGSPAEPQLAVHFERLSERSRAHLDALLAEHASGPALAAHAAPRPAPAPGSSRPPRGGDRLRALAREEEATPARTATPPPEIERRRRRRGVWHEELVALDRESDRALVPLLGSDLSVGGVRVEPNPLLRIGDRLRLALYDPDRAEPLVLEARVAHDDGRRGVGLVFVDASEEQQACLLALVDALPPITVLDDTGEKPRNLMVGEIVARSGAVAAEAAGSAAAHGEPADGEAQHDHGAAEHHDDEA